MQTKEVFSVGKVVSRIAMIIAVVEILIMAVFSRILDAVGSGEVAGFFLDVMILLDALLLVIFAAPLVYFWVVKPFVLERDEAIEKVTLLAHYDPLTDLANRRLIHQNLNIVLARCLRRGAYGALLQIDLDKFKPINDTHGHDAGDAMLVAVAKRLSSVVREEDVVGRTGGDEFVVLVDELETSEQVASDTVLNIARKLQSKISEPLTFNGNVIQVDSSMGICLFSKEKLDIDTVFKRADIAMYQAKERDVKYVVYSDN